MRRYPAAGVGAEMVLAYDFLSRVALFNGLSLGD